MLPSKSTPATTLALKNGLSKNLAKVIISFLLAPAKLLTFRTVVLIKLSRYTANGTAAQVWKFQTQPKEEKTETESDAKDTKKSSDSTRLLEDGTYEIYSSVGSNFVLDVYGSTAKNAKDGTNIQIYKYINVDTQRFKVTYDSSKDVYSIVNPYANRSIDVSGANMKNSANIQLYTINNTCAQLWKLTKNSDGTFTVASSCNKNMVLDVSGANAKNGANVQLYTSNGTKAQKWTFKKI